ncbi:MAG: GNAT family N-acetyltransferase [Gemmatimonadaceae bacterium]|nr:GNAT family N-acetyltransferase [Gemmatimonadaceae bacterium]
MSKPAPTDTFHFAPISQLEPERIEQFAREVWPGEGDRKNVLESWWMTTSADVATAAVETATGRIAGLCVGVPSEWDIDRKTVSAASICNWYVSPEFMGRGVGKKLVRSFTERAPYMNAFSVSAAAIKNFLKLGWSGPFRSMLLLLPLPLLSGALWRPQPGLSVATFRTRGTTIPPALSAMLDQIDCERPSGTLRRRRRSSDWRRHLAYFPDRVFDIHIVCRDSHPIGYFALRRADRYAGRIYRLARLSYVSDMAINDLRPDAVRFMLGAIAAAPAVRSAGAVLLCTTDAQIAEEAVRSGWLSEKSPLIGSRLEEKAPLYMKGDGFKDGGLANRDLQLTFFDSDVDLNV